MELLVRAAISGVIVAVASEVARRSSILGAVVISLPLTSILAIVWLYRETRDPDQIASFAWSILWIVPPSLVFFVVLPVSLGRGVEFAPALGAACVATIAAYALWIAGARVLGVGD